MCLKLLSIPLLGNFECKVLSFGLTNAPATFQAAVNSKFKPHPGKLVLVYLDDIAVLSKSPEEHAEYLDIVLRLLWEHTLFAKHSNRQSHNAEQDIHMLPSFLGLTDYFRHFVQTYANFVGP